jgi:16S rRNA U1498 N3-methylase RsmE
MEGVCLNTIFKVYGLTSNNILLITEGCWLHTQIAHIHAHTAYSITFTEYILKVGGAVVLWVHASLVT